MRIGWVGLGRLGLPCAQAQESAGHTVIGTDLVHREWAGFRGSIGAVVAESDIIYVAVQTPHAPQFGGESRINGEYRDFEYGYLDDAYREVCRAVERGNQAKTVAVVSTCLPGTIRRRLVPVTPGQVQLIYHPLFIAQGTVREDYINPEFVLLGLGESDSGADGRIMDLYSSLCPGAPIVSVGYESAEMAKMTYNTFISMKILVANGLMEMCEHTAADCDEVLSVLSHATRRLWSPAYMRGGMGDGGACHPRDNVALAYLADKLRLSYNLFATVIDGREQQARFIAESARKWSEVSGLPIALCGKEYKADSDITDGSAALLVQALLDPTPAFVEPDTVNDPRVFVITCNHTRYEGARFPPGSIVVDPWGYMPVTDDDGVMVQHLGRNW